MTEPSLLVASLTAFIAVALLLSLLAGVIRLLTAVFPERETHLDDGALIAAIHATAARAHPRSRITRIEEIR